MSLVLGGAPVERESIAHRWPESTLRLSTSTTVVDPLRLLVDARFRRAIVDLKTPSTMKSVDIHGKPGDFILRKRTYCLYPSRLVPPGHVP